MAEDIKISSFSSTGFIQPAFAENMLTSPDADGFNDRQLMDFPPEREVYLRELKVPIPDEVPKLLSIYKVLRDAHTNPKEYTLSTEAYTVFEAAHDQLVDRKQRTEDEDIQGISSKAKGYTARLAMILFALKQAIEHLTNPAPHPTWSTEISATTVEAAEKIMNSISTQKIIILDKSQDQLDMHTASCRLS